MQSLDVISINIWQILISLSNLVLLFLLVKKFLFKPVNNMLERRKSEIERQYSEADKTSRLANAQKAEWDFKMTTAKREAEELMQTASDSAKKYGEKIVNEAKENAEIILKQAKKQITLERKSAKEDIKREIIEISSLIAETVLKREVGFSEHHDLIASVINEIGDNNELG